MQAGDVVRCKRVTGEPLGLIMAVWNGNHHTSKGVVDVYVFGKTGIMPFQRDEVEALNESR